MNDLKRLIREVPDYPKPGILFYDLTTLLKDKDGFHTLIDRLCEHYESHHIDVVAGIEARGFIFAPALAYRLKVGQMIGVKVETLNHACEGVVSEIVPEAQSASRSFQVKVAGPCPPGIYSGMFGRILIPLGEEKILVIPAKAVRQVGQLELVDVVEKGVSPGIRLGL